MTKLLQVKFLKSVSKLEGPLGNDSYIHRTADGDAFLMAAVSGTQRVRYHFHGGDVSGAFPSAESRQKYMDTINSAAGETICVAAEAA